jgi:hypothetical protein
MIAFPRLKPYVASILTLAPLAFVPALPGLWLWRTWIDNDAGISEALMRFDRLRSVASYGPTLAAMNQDVDDRPFADLLLGEGTPAILSANLLTQLKELAAANGIDVLRAGNLPPNRQGPLVLIGGELEMSGAVPAVYALIGRIQSARPYLFIDSLTIRAADPAAGEDGETSVAVEMRVQGAIIADASAPEERGG